MVRLIVGRVVVTRSAGMLSSYQSTTRESASVRLSSSPLISERRRLAGQSQLTQPSLQNPQTLLFRHQRLPLLQNLPLNPRFRLSEILFFSSELFFFESDGLIGEIFGEDGGVAAVRCDNKDCVSGARAGIGLPVRPAASVLQDPLTLGLRYS